jgi:nitrogen fixation protein
MAVNINIPSQVSQTITDGVTDKAPSEDAVFDALALKANTGDLGNYVPYTGANNDVNLGTYNLTADHINLNVSPSGAGFVVGSTQWNNTLGSSETLLKGGNVTLKNGVDLVARVVNKVVPNTTLTKAQYQAVKVSGATGGRLSVGLAQANTDLNSADTIGLVTETIATNQEGFIITVGQIENIDTTGNLQGETWTDGDVLYLSPTVAGKLTNIKPTGATGHIVVIGYVEYAHANNGKIYVKVMNGWELDELHNVNITNPTGGAVLEYQASTQLWIDSGIQYTIELIDALTVDFYAPYNLVITSVSNVLNAPTITIQDDNVAYTLGNTIAVGSKITVTGSVASVVNLNITK